MYFFKENNYKYFYGLPAVQPSRVGISIIYQQIVIYTPTELFPIWDATTLIQI